MMMAQQARRLTDDELSAIFNDDQTDLSLLSDEEQQRLLTLTESLTKEPAPPDALARAVEPISDIVTPVVRSGLDIGRGATAGLMATAFRGGDVIRRGWNYVAPSAFDVERPILTPEAKAAMTPPPTVAGKIGFIGEQVAEMAAPMRAVSTAVMKAPLVARMGAEGATGGVAAALQGGDPRLGVALGAAGPAMGAAAAAPPVAGAARALRESAERKIDQALGATEKYFKAEAEKIIPQLRQLGITGWSGMNRRRLLDLARREARRYGNAIEQAIQASGATVVGTQSIDNALEAAKQAYIKREIMTVRESLQRGLTASATPLPNNMVEVEHVLEELPVRHLSELQALVRRFGPDATVEHVVAIKRAWDAVVDMAGGYSHRRPGAIGRPLPETAEAWAKSQGTKAIRELLATLSPDIAALNKEASFWIGLRNVVSQTVKRTRPQEGGLRQAIYGSAGLAAGAMIGGAESAAVGGVTGLIANAVSRQLFTAFTSPRWRFISANLRNQLADALVSGKTPDIVRATNQMTTALAAGGALKPQPTEISLTIRGPASVPAR